MTPSSPDRSGLAALRARFMADFTAGRVGRRHNIFQHRERMLRQLNAAADAAARTRGA